MRRTDKQPYFSKSWMIALLIGLVFVVLGYGLRFEIEIRDPDAGSSLDLMLFLLGYLFVFCLKPIQAAIHRKLCRRAFRSNRQKASS
jgi:hypothetical protein